MLISNVSLPHPVFGLNDDYLNGTYETEVKVAPTESLMSFIIEHKLPNKAIEKLISSGKILFCIEVNCPSTLYRNSFLSREKTQRFEISQDLLRGRFSITFYVSANEDLGNYKNEEFNPDYKNTAFDLKKGDVIAYGGISYFTAIKDWNALKSLKTYMNIAPGSETGYMEVILGTEKITVLLPDEDYKKYLDVIVYEEIPPIIHSSIVYPAILYALRQISKDIESQEGKEWFEFLKFKKEQDPELKTFEWQQSEDEISRFAQCLLGKPIKRMIDALYIQKQQENEISD